MLRTFFMFIFVAASLELSEGSGNLKALDWWQTTLLYQIYPRSFKDSNGDGVGDLNGIHEKLDYLKDIGVDTIWIQPFYKSPMIDMGYDIEDFKSVDPLFGTINDFEKLLKSVKDRGMRLLVDFVPNHSSDKHEWFRLSEQGVEPYTDFYIWKNGKQFNDSHTTVPNNWKSVFGGSAWTWSEKRQQYYFHQFAPQQPDLDFRNPKVRKEMEGVLRFWLDLGVDGFRVDATPFLFEAAHFKDEPEAPPGSQKFIWETRIYTFEQPENVELVKSWRSVLDEYTKQDGHTRLLCTENYSPPQKLVEYIGNETYPGAHVPFYYYLTFVTPNWNTTYIDMVVHMQTAILPKSSYNWVLDNHDNRRMTSRLFQESVDSWLMCILLLPGLASIYYGTEIGLDDLKLRPDQMRDILNGGNGRSDPRDAYRAPMQWDDSENAGFTSAKQPWLPVHPNFWRVNVRSQEREPNSHLNIFKQLAALRKSPVITHGDLQTYTLKSWVYMFTRSLEDETIAVLMNIGSDTEEVCAKDVAPFLPDKMFVHIRSINSKHNTGDKVRISRTEGTGCVKMRPQTGLVLSTSLGVSALPSFIILFFAVCSKLLL